MREPPVAVKKHINTSTVKRLGAAVSISRDQAAKRVLRQKCRHVSAVVTRVIFGTGL